MIRVRSTTRLFLPALGVLLVPLMVALSLQPLYGETVLVELKLDPNRLAGADAFGAPLLFTPNPVEPGSSVSHFDTSATPNLLMEPSINQDLSTNSLDLTTAAFRDLGWSTNGGATITLNYNDSSSTGFNDPNRGTARRNALRQAATVLAASLTSSVTIHVDAQFTSLPCDSDGATLAQAGAQFLFKDFNNAPLSNTWYHGALAESLSGSNLSLEDVSDPTAGELTVNFNSQIDEACLGNGTGFFYGSGPAPSSQVSFLAVAMHEMAHGLGFSSFINESTGQFFQGDPDIFSQLTIDRTRNKRWAKMTPAEIRQSAVNTSNVAFDGPRVIQRAKSLLDRAPSAIITSPSSVAGSYQIGTATFGPAVSSQGVKGEIVAVSDQNGSTTACSAIATDLAGRIALVDRGNCLFTDKAIAAQQAGAAAVIIANNEPDGVITMGTSNDPGVKILTVMVSRDVGATIRTALASAGGDDGGDGGDDGDDGGDGGNDGGDGGDDGGSEGPETGTEAPSDCQADTTTLCLNQGRFRVTVDFETKAGESGSGNTVELSGDTGYFWFFRSDNVETVVKVLDACNGFDSFWVFAAGLTNVEVELKVADTETGRFNIYRNPQGTEFQPIQDTSAFKTCN